MVEFLKPRGVLRPSDGHSSSRSGHLVCLDASKFTYPYEMRTFSSLMSDTSLTATMLPSRVLVRSPRTGLVLEFHRIDHTRHRGVVVYKTNRNISLVLFDDSRSG